MHAWTFFPVCRRRACFWDFVIWAAQPLYTSLQQQLTDCLTMQVSQIFDQEVLEEAQRAGLATSHCLKQRSQVSNI